MTLGEHITIFWKKKNISQAELGKSVGTSSNIIYCLLNWNKAILKKIQDIQKLNADDKVHVFALLYAFL